MNADDGMPHDLDYHRNESDHDTNKEVVLNNEHRYGWGCVKMDCLQVLNKPGFMIAFLCFATFGQGFVVVGVGTSIITTLEKHFGLTSRKVTQFGVTYDAVYGLCSIFIGFLARFHKLRIVGIGLCVMVAASVLHAVAKFVKGPHNAGSPQYTDYCRTHNATDSSAFCKNTETWRYELILIIANVFLAIGAVPLFTLAPAHIDEVTDRNDSALYFGCYYASNSLGPLLGYVLGFPLLTTWVDIETPPGFNLTPLDTNWVGAWWLGYLIGAGILVLPVLPILGYPREFPNTERVRCSKRERIDTVLRIEVKQKSPKLKVLHALKRLLVNPQYMLINCGIITEGLSVAGTGYFMSKFIETQFFLSAGDSSIYTGVLIVPGIVIGAATGGIVVKRMKLSCKQILKMATILAGLSIIFIPFFFVGCNGTKVEDMKIVNGTPSFDNACNIGCNCNTNLYVPICTKEDQKMYYSPCHAGCSIDNIVGIELHNCTCVSPNVTMATYGRCTNGCTTFPLFGVGVLLFVFLTIMNNVPLINATFRVVEENQGTFAMGFQQVMVRLLSFVPAPIMFASLIDKSCSLWLTNSCSGNKDNCLEYNQRDFRLYMFILNCVCKAASFIFIGLAFYTYKLPTNNRAKENNGDAREMDDVVRNSVVVT